MKLSEVQKAVFNMPLEIKEVLPKGNELSLASKDKFKNLYPNIDLSKNQDVVLVACETAIANLVNENDDVILTEAALNVTPTFEYKPFNVEHDIYSIVGCITNHGFSSFKDKKPLRESDIDKNSFEPFYLNFGGVLWKRSGYSVVKELAENEMCKEYISSSWEIGFNEIYIATGSKKIADATIITDDETILEYKKYLKAYGGNGFLPDGTPVYRVLAGDIVGVGIGLTRDPAAEVGSISILTSPQEKKDTATSSANKKNKENISIKQNKNVNIRSMKIELDKITQEDLAEVSVASIHSAFNEAMTKVSSEYKAKLDEKENEAKTFKGELETSKASISDLENKVIALTNELDSLKKEKIEREAKEIAEARFKDISSKFDIAEAAVDIVKNRIAGCSDDVSYASLVKEFEVLLPKKAEGGSGEGFELSTASQKNKIIPNTSRTQDTFKTNPVKVENLPDGSLKISV